MKIFATGDERRLTELKLKFGNEISSGEVGDEAVSALMNYDVIFDLNADEKNTPRQYALLENKLIILCSVKKSLSMIMSEVKKNVTAHVVGMNLLPTFINRSKLEISALRKEDKHAFKKFSDETNVEFLEVEDQIGMVTPRVICMIINEACYSLQQGVASITDIDKAMKLGTNYPYGPFEWCDRISVKDVYETLVAIRNDTHDERYEICGLLKEKYLKKETFYS